MEVSNTPILDSDRLNLESMVNKVFMLDEHIYIKEVMDKLDNTDTNLTARKTIGELIGTLEFLSWLKQQPIKFSRVFKIAGRLSLNDNFLKIDYSRLQGKAVCSKKYWYDRYVYLIQLWSFDHVLLNDIFDIFVEIWNHEIDSLRTKGVLDVVESMLYAYLNAYKIPVEEISETDYIGVEGKHGQDGAEVNV